MKRLLLVVAILSLASCGKSPEEKMLYDYQAQTAKSLWNMDIENLKFDIHSIEKVSTIKGKDSINHYKNKLADIWVKGMSDEQKDTLTYDFIITQLDTLADRYQKLILGYIELGMEYKNYELKEKRNQAIRESSKAKEWQILHQKYSKLEDSVISTKYLASYSIQNPLLNNNIQTFDRYFYTDKNNQKFIRMEENEDERSN